MYIVRTLVRKKVLFIKTSDKNGVIPNKKPQKSWLTMGTKVIAFISKKKNKDRIKLKSVKETVWYLGEIQFKEKDKYQVFFDDENSGLVSLMNLRVLRKQSESGLEALSKMFHSSTKVLVRVRGVRYTGRIEYAGHNYVKIKITIPLKEPGSGLIHEITRRMSFVNTLKLSDKVDVNINCKRFPSRVKQITTYTHRGIPFKYMMLSFSVNSNSIFSIGKVLRIKINKYPYFARVLSNQKGKVKILVPFRARSNKLPRSVRKRIYQARERLRFFKKKLIKKGTTIFAMIGGQSSIPSESKVKAERSNVMFKTTSDVGNVKRVPVEIDGRTLIGEVSEKVSNYKLVTVPVTKDIVRKFLKQEERKARNQEIKSLLRPPKVPAMFLRRSLFGYTFLRWLSTGDRIYAVDVTQNVWYPAKVTRIVHKQGEKERIYFRFIKGGSDNVYSLSGTIREKVVPYRYIRRKWFKKGCSVLVVRGQKLRYGAYFGIFKGYDRRSRLYRVRIRLKTRKGYKGYEVLVSFRRLILMPVQPPSIPYYRQMEHVKTILSYDGVSWTYNGRKNIRPWIWEYENVIKHSRRSSDEHQRLRRKKGAKRHRNVWRTRRQRQRRVWAVKKRRRHYGVFRNTKSRTPVNVKLNEFRKTSKRKKKKKDNEEWPYYPWYN